MHPGQHQRMVQNIMFKQIWRDIHTKPTNFCCLEVPVSKQKVTVTRTKSAQVVEGKTFRGTRLTQVIDGDSSTPASHDDDQHLKENTCWSFLQGYDRQTLIKGLARLLIRTWSCHSNNPSRQSTRVSLQIKAHFPIVTLGI